MNVELGVTFNNLRKALFVILGGKGDPNDFSSKAYAHIIPLVSNIVNPFRDMQDETILEDFNFDNDTLVMYWIENDSSIGQSDFTPYENEDLGISMRKMSRQKNVASVLVRFCGKQAETVARQFRHHVHRVDINPVWHYVCNAQRLEGVSELIPRRIYFNRKQSQIAFDIHFKLYYDEYLDTGIVPLNDIDFTVSGTITEE